MLSPLGVKSWRDKVWEHGFRPVAVYNHDAAVAHPGKQPKGDSWSDRARQDPPKVTTEWPESEALNTGILCDGLVALDLDTDDTAVRNRVARLAWDLLGPAPCRTRADSPRCLYLYRASEGEPHKRTLGKPGRKIEILGKGNQFVAFGIHELGSAYEWPYGGPDTFHRNQLTAVTQEAVQALLEALAPILEVPRPLKPQTFAAKLTTRSQIPHVRDMGAAKAALKDESSKLRVLRLGDHRNEALNKAAFVMGTFIGLGAIDVQDVINELWDAAAANGYRSKDGDDAAWTTLQSGLDAGILQPRESLAIDPAVVPVDVRAIVRNGLNPSIPVRETGVASGIKAFNIDTIMSPFDYESPSIEYAVHNIIPYSAITMMSGDSGCGKTTLITKLADAISAGKPIMGYPAYAPRLVLYLDKENSLPIIRERMTRCGVQPNGNFKYWGRHVNGDVGLPGSKEVNDWVRSKSPRPVVFVDGLIAFLEGKESSSDDIRAFFQPLQELASLGAAVVVLHHTGKGESTLEFRGSSDIKAAIDIGYVMKNDGGTRLTTMTLKAFKTRIAVDDKIALTYSNGEFLRQEMKQATEDILTHLLRDNAWINKKQFEDFAKAKGIGQSRLRDFVDDGLAHGAIVTKKGDKNATLLALADLHNIREWSQALSFQ